MDHNALNPLPLGAVVHERYRVNAVVGRGGLGTVYSVLDILFGKQNIYALKEMADQSRSARRQFEHEAQWLQALDHNHIPKVREYFEWRSRLYLVMDFVDGENLEQKLYNQGGRPLSEEQVIAWILPICDALQYLHTRRPSILHRDVKPANIIVTPAGHPVLVDLGIAKEHLPGAGRTATFVRKAGTEGYAPPEQYTVAGKSGPWSDVYALGATLYHLLTMQVPVSAIDRVTQDPDLIHPAFYNRAISQQTDAAICRAMAMRPADRFQSIAEFAAALSGAPMTFQSPLSGTPRGQWPSGPSAPSYAPGWDAPMSPPPSSMPSAPLRGGVAPQPQPYSRSMPAGGPELSPRAPSNAPPRTPSPPPSRYPSFTSSHPSVNDVGSVSGMNNMGQIDLSLPPLPPSQPSVMASVGRASKPALQSSPEATAAEHERIRESVTGRKRVTSGPRRGFSSRGPLLIGIALVFILVAVGIATYMVVPRLAPPDRSTPQITITGYFDALKQDDFSRAWQFASASHNDTASQDVFTQNLRADDSRYGKVISFHILSVDTDGSSHATALVQTARANAPGSPVVYSIALSQFDGTTWLMDSIASQ
ncbi:MAG TPA: serine/threonine-protein kinase [Ktedonobacterales bacterium]|nr:serine/threonine-protein kinase [Ktedonobacterales bacterium]